MRSALMASALILAATACAPVGPPSVEAIHQGQTIDVVRDEDGNTALVDRTGKGPMLCVWSLYVAAQDVGRQCFPGQDKRLQAELATSIRTTDAFILKNSSSHPTPADLAVRKAVILREVKAQACAGDTLELYRAFQKGGVAALRASTDEMLSIPREPVMNPCV